VQAVSPVSALVEKTKLPETGFRIHDPLFVSTSNVYSEQNEYKTQAATDRAVPSWNRKWNR
jgi:hypothetical protein